MSGLFGGSGGGSLKSPQDVNVPAFTSSGGITPQQDALGQYSLGENLLAQANQFGSSGTGDSTMATQGAEGATNATAMQVAGMSDTNEAAQYGLYQNDLSAMEQNLSNDVALNQSSSTNLGSLAQAAGFGSGSSGATTTTATS